MKPINIKSLKILAFIPIVNSLCMFFFIYNFSKSKRQYKLIFRAVIEATVIMVAIVLAFDGISRLLGINNLDNNTLIQVISFIKFYIETTALSVFLVIFQKKHMPELFN